MTIPPTVSADIQCLPYQYATDSAKVFFAISYLKKSALEWFENGIMELIPALSPIW